MSSTRDIPETQNGYIDTEPAPMFSSFEEMMEFMQAQLLPKPEPKEIKHVVLDADDTMWDIDPWGVASLGSPVGHTEGNELPVELKVEKLAWQPSYWSTTAPVGSVKLDPTLRDTLDKLKQKGIPVSIASNNSKKSIIQYLNAFGLKNAFADIEATWFGSKGEMVNNIARRNNVDSKKILFVDDSPNNAMDVSHRTGAMPLIAGYDIQAIDEILEFIK